MKKEKVYISGAITGTTDFKQRFEKAEDELKQKGYDVFNPAKVEIKLTGNETKGEIWCKYMDVCLKELKKCQYIHFLENYKSSDGVEVEKIYAKKLNIQKIWE